jgi:hypothetical protein
MKNLVPTKLYASIVDGVMFYWIYATNFHFFFALSNFNPNRNFWLQASKLSTSSVCQLYLHLIQTVERKVFHLDPVFGGRLPVHVPWITGR